MLGLILTIILSIFMFAIINKIFRISYFGLQGVFVLYGACFIISLFTLSKIWSIIF